MRTAANLPRSDVACDPRHTGTPVACLWPQGELTMNYKALLSIVITVTVLAPALSFAESRSPKSVSTGRAAKVTRLGHRSSGKKGDSGRGMSAFSLNNYATYTVVGGGAGYRMDYYGNYRGPLGSNNR